jgi:hypothetical protein
MHQTRLVNFNGRLFIRWDDISSDEPVLVRLFYPIGLRTSDRFEVSEFPADGFEAHKDGPGTYSVRILPHVYSRWALINGGQTVPEYNERLPIPCPKVRKGIETRWRNGEWVKLLKTGWMRA